MSPSGPFHGQGVFFVSVAVVLVVVLWGAITPAGLAAVATAALDFTIARFGWFYLLAALGFVAFSLYVALSRHGTVRLGRDDEEPVHSYRSWIAMLFSAGMGIGLVFWGVAEPVSHYMNPPPDIEPATVEAARAAVRYSFFHWGLHAWAIYTSIGMAIGYFSFRKGGRGLVSAAFEPLLGQRVHGPLGQAIDTLAIVATVFGVATSLGLGTLQVNGGLAHTFGLHAGVEIQLGIIAVLTVLYMISAATGLNRGIKILSNVNIAVAGGLMLFTLVAGPTSYIIDVFTTTLGGYVHSFIPTSLRLTPFDPGEWIAAWTLFYWAWWIAWAPFVGMFIARVSRGRTIREFVMGALLVPSVLSFLWFATFGGMALHLEMVGGLRIAALVEADVTSALFLTLEQLPMGALLAGLATLLIITFFVTSADSATFVLGMLSSRGALTPSTRIKLTWGLLQSSVAAVLLLSGGLDALRTAAIVAAAPFAVIMILMCASLMIALRGEDRERREREALRRRRLDRLLEQNERANEESP